jgi:Ca2+-binding RTX toxin-like protein
VAVTSDSSHLYVSLAGGGNVAGFAIASDGGLTPVAGSPFEARSNPAAVMVTPDQGPVARFSATVASPGLASKFDGSASSDADGTVVRYSWRFGDGSGVGNGGPKPSHTYGAAGSYKVTLTVTDDGGCSTRRVFTGQTMSCNGSAAAHVTQTVNVSATRCAGRRATIEGGARADRLAGTGARDVILGGSGNDRILAGGGADFVCAGAGNDRIVGGGGNDRLFGGRGNDHLLGGAGNDRITAGSGRDRVAAGRGNDRIFSRDSRAT